MFRAAKTDANASEIDKALILRGATVAKTDSAGSGFPDRVIGFKGKNYLLEYKDGSNPPSKRRMNMAQEQWHASWAGQVDVVKNPEEAVKVVFGSDKRHELPADYGEQ
jgi:hypothetical protein